MYRTSAGLASTWIIGGPTKKYDCSINFCDVSKDE